MCKRNNDALFFTCSLIEQIGRALQAKRGRVAAGLPEKGIHAIYKNANILHCEQIEKVAEDVITEFGLQDGNYDNISGTQYSVPDVWTIGRVYARLIEDVSEETNVEETVMQVFPRGSTTSSQTTIPRSTISRGTISQNAIVRDRFWTVDNKPISVRVSVGMTPSFLQRIAISLI